MSFPNDRIYAFDANLVLADGAAALTATSYGQVGGANAILDLGGNQGVTPKQQARIDAVCVINVSAIDISSGNETYKLIVVGSNDPGLASSNVVLGEIMLGKGASLDILNGLDSVTGQYELFFATQQGGNLYEFIALYAVLGGTTPSITFTADVAVLPEP